MSGELNLRRGTKMMMAYDVAIGKAPKFEYMCAYEKDIDGSVFLVSIPMNPDGTPVPIDENKKFLFVFGSGPLRSILAGYADDEIKEGIRTFWKVRRVTEQRQFFKRADERVKAQLEIEYTCGRFAEMEDGTTKKEKTYTADISYSGSSVFVNENFDVGDVCEVFLPGVGIGIGSDPMNHIRAAVCWNREAPKESSYRLVVGLRYRFADEIQKERMKLYVEHIKREYGLNNRD